ncbi:MAG TPA: hypothetical protein VFW07_12430 [Parafilimonas sp.]|nr:hypothetical protein [Parafilimonas sp.]
MRTLSKVCILACLSVVISGCTKTSTITPSKVIASSQNNLEGQQTAGRQHIITLKTGDRNYPNSKTLMWLPNLYKTDPNRKKTYPLIINLYGQEQCGTDINLLLEGFTMSEYIAQGFNATAINPVDGRRYAFFVCSPQCPVSWGWSAKHVYNMLEQLKDMYPIDTTRIYLTGFSAGGWGLWSCMTDNNNLTKQFAAIVPLSAASADHPDKLSNVAKFDIACLDICGSKDAFYKTNLKYVDIINSGNPEIPAKFIRLDGVGHIAWKFAYNNTWKMRNGMNIYEWMLKHKRRN